VPETVDTEARIVMPTTHIEIVLKYDGKDVDDGSMPIEDVISALRGFSGAYGKIASIHDPNGQHQIRVSAINHSSFAVTIVAWATEHKDALLAISKPIASFIVKTIMKLIEFTKATKGQPPPGNVQIDGNNNMVFTVGGNTTIVVPLEVYELRKSKAVDADLARIVDPLHEGKVDVVSIQARDDNGPLLPGTLIITSSEKEYFRSEDVTTTTSKPLDLDGHFVSLNKDSNRGMFRMQTGASVKYHLVGDDPVRMHPDFAYTGPVRVRCMASFDSNLVLNDIAISGVERLQSSLFDDGRSEASAQI
jgi:hypothetical protein